MKCPIQVFSFSIKNSNNDSVDIHIDGQIVDASSQALLKAWFGDDTSVSFRSFRDQLNAIDARVYNIFINSPGGLVTDAMAMHDFLTALESKGKTVNRIGRGIVASAATYILMVPNSSMTKNSWIMVHNVSGMVWGTVEEVESYATMLRQFNNRSRDFYAEQSGMRKEEISKMMNTETWMTADEALEKGFIKQVIGAENFSKSIKNENWDYANTTVLNHYNSFVRPDNDSQANSIEEKLENMKKFFSDLGANIMNALKGVKAPENNDHAALMTSIGTAVSQSFEQGSEQFEKAVLESEAVKTSIATQIYAAIDGIDFSKEGPAKIALDTAVTNATKDFSEKITALETAKTALEKKNGELETDITNLKGKQSQSQRNETEVIPVGKYN